MRHQDDFLKRYGNWALVVGAAKGIGAAFAKNLAQQGVNLVLADVAEEELKEITIQLEAENKIAIKIVIVDLRDTDAHLKIMGAAITENCRLLIYNAAISAVRKFTDTSTNELDSLLQVNVSTQLKIVHAFARHLKDKEQKGGILLMSSLAGLLGMQLVAAYGATKAFAWNLAEALHHELKPLGIDVSTCIAGATLSQTYLDTKPKYSGIKPQLQSCEEVADYALKMLGSKAICISGFSNRLNYFFLTRVLPRKMAARIANKVIGKMYG